MTEQNTITLDDSHQGLRLDKALAMCFTDMSRSRLQQLITGGHVTSNDVVTNDAKKKVSAGQTYTVCVPEAVAAKPQAQDIPLDIVFEDEMLLVINKPVGLLVHPGAGNPDKTLVNALLHHCPDSLSGIGGVARPGIVHRIDKDTSGLLIVAKTDVAHQKLAVQLENRSLSRRYQALVWGLPNPNNGEINAPIGRDPKNRQRMCVTSGAPLTRGQMEDGAPVILGAGKEAITNYQLVEAYGTLVSLVECKLQTGRTHQIRVHMKHVGHPLIGDKTYGSRKGNQLRFHDEAVVQALKDFPRQALHARALEFIHPGSNEKMRFECPLPDDIQTLKDLLLNATRG